MRLARLARRDACRGVAQHDAICPCHRRSEAAAHVELRRGEPEGSAKGGLYWQGGARLHLCRDGSERRIPLRGHQIGRRHQGRDRQQEDGDCRPAQAAQRRRLKHPVQRGDESAPRWLRRRRARGALDGGARAARLHQRHGRRRLARARLARRVLLCGHRRGQSLPRAVRRARGGAQGDVPRLTHHRRGLPTCLFGAVCFLRGIRHSRLARGLPF
mmetsp:Transcript_35477/g.117585  ORF Transcript_35477/g.117585 Transcript_35477/m.117585 type:complete len:215 (-) Transcript_35477:1039-1683(-)